MPSGSSPRPVGEVKPLLSKFLTAVLTSNRLPWAGRSRPRPLPRIRLGTLSAQHLWLASQAIQKGFKLLTRNEKSFEDIPGLDLVVFPKPSAIHIPLPGHSSPSGWLRRDKVFWFSRQSRSSDPAESARPNAMRKPRCFFEQQRLSRGG